jgi:cyclopropane-fatty-acyl-phospholipid synthase
MEAVEPAAVGGASKSAVQHHYDLSNDFFGLWLDETRTYSSAMWEGARSLEDAQRRKLAYHIERAGASGAGAVLDIGCGWGSQLRALVGSGGVERAVGLTLSDAQSEWIARSPDPRIHVHVEGWEDHVPETPYDAIISVGAFEHFARPDSTPEEVVAAYRRFFARCHDWLAPGGRISLQTIAYGTARREDLNRFIIEKIFPESDLPTLSAIDRASFRLFEITSLRNDRADYEATLKCWYRSLRARRADAVALVGEQTVVDYERYLSLFMVGFHTGAMNLLRIAFRRIDAPRSA